MAVRRWILAVVLSVSVLAALANFSLLNQTAGGLAGIAEKQRGGLAALELARAEVDPAFLLTEENSGVDYLGLSRRGFVLLGDRRSRFARLHRRRARRRV